MAVSAGRCISMRASRPNGVVRGDDPASARPLMVVVSDIVDLRCCRVAQTVAKAPSPLRPYAAAARYPSQKIAVFTLAVRQTLAAMVRLPGLADRRYLRLRSNAS